MHKSTQGVLSKATALLKSTRNLIFPCYTQKSSLDFSVTERKYISFKYSSVNFTFSHLQKFTPPVSAFMRVHPLSYTLTSKSFTFSRKNKTTIGCLSELLDNCVCIFFNMKATFLIIKGVCFWYTSPQDQSRWRMRNMVFIVVKMVNKCFT